MFTLQIQVDDSEDLRRIGVLHELMFCDSRERDITSESLYSALDWICDKLEAYLEEGINVNHKEFLPLAHQFDSLAELIRSSSE